MWRVWIVPVIALAVGCASAPIRKPDLAALDEADRLVLQGCYDCFLDAQRTYLRLAVGKARPIVIDRLFEVTLLMALRERELALDASASIAAARALARELPAALDAERYVALVEAVPPDDTGTPRRALSDFRAGRRGFVRTLDAELSALAAAPLRPAVRAYLALALDCGYLTRAGGEGPREPREAPPGAPPLIVFRAAICGMPSQPTLYRLRQNDARFVEASVFLARFDLAVAEQNGPGRARERLAEGLARFPESPLVTYLSGNFFRFVAECDAAVAAYDRTVALADGHEQARLGRVMCLSYLKMHDEAIRGATAMIDRRLDYLADAYYWRAWNHRERSDLTPARADIEHAKQLGTTSEILTLAGMIEHDQDALDPAERDLRAAQGLPNGELNCTAWWYLGLVDRKRPNALAAGRHFEEAMGCYLRTAAYTRAKLAAFRARSDLDPAWRAAQASRLETVVAECMTQHHAAALHAATLFATANDLAAARRLVEIAAADPALAEPVARLREWLRGR